MRFRTMTLFFPRISWNYILQKRKLVTDHICSSVKGLEPLERCSKEPVGVDIFTQFSLLCYPVWIEVLRRADPLHDSFCYLSKGFSITKLILNRNRPEGLICDSQRRGLIGTYDHRNLLSYLLVFQRDYTSIMLDIVRGWYRHFWASV